MLCMSSSPTCLSSLFQILSHVDFEFVFVDIVWLFLCILIPNVLSTEVMANLGWALDVKLLSHHSISLKLFCSWFFPVLCSIAFKFEKHNVHFPTVGWLHGLPRLLLEDSQEKLQHTCDPCEDKWFRWIGGYSIVSLSSCLIQSGKVCIGLMHPNSFWKYSTCCVISSLCQIYEAFLPVTDIHP